MDIGKVSFTSQGWDRAHARRWEVQALTVKGGIRPLGLEKSLLNQWDCLCWFTADG